MPSLREELRAKRDSQDAEVKALYDSVAGLLADSGFADRILTVGDQFPDVALPTGRGHLETLSNWWQRGPLVVAFFRGEWCPYCRLMLTALEVALPEIKAFGANLIAVTPDTGGRGLRAQRAHGDAYEVLSDVDCGLGLNCGVVFRVPPVYRSMLLKFGNDLTERHGNDAWFLPVPATFLLDREGIIRWRFAEVDWTQRVEPTDLVAALRLLTMPAEQEGNENCR